MCLATVYIEDDGQREQVMQDVAWVKPENGEIRLTTLLGESKLFQAQIDSINLIDGSIVLKGVSTGSPERIHADQGDKPA